MLLEKSMSRFPVYARPIFPPVLTSLLPEILALLDLVKIPIPVPFPVILFFFIEIPFFANSTDTPEDLFPFGLPHFSTLDVTYIYLVGDFTLMPQLYLPEILLPVIFSM